MHNIFLKITTLIFIALAIIIALPWLNGIINSQKTDPLKNANVNLSSFTQETVSKISIKNGADEKILSFSDNKWLIDKDEAAEDKVKQFFQDLASLKVKELASQSEENFEKFEVAKDKNSFQLTLTQGGKDSIFFVGKIGASTNDFHLRKEGFKNTYLVNGELRDKLNWEVAKWKKEEAEKNAT